MPEEYSTQTAVDYHSGEEDSEDEYTIPGKEQIQRVDPRYCRTGA